MDEVAEPQSLAVARILSRSRDEWLSDELRQILDALPTFVFVAEDPACQSMFGNQATEQLLRAPRGANVSKSAPAGIWPRDFMAYDSDGTLLSPEELPVQRAARGEEVSCQEFELRFEDGERVWLFGNAVPLRSEDGTVWGAVGAFSDISVRKRAEAELARVNAARTRLLAAASHDLRQPVQGLSLLLGALEGTPPANIGPIVAKLKSCASVLMTQFDEIMAFTKAESGLISVNYQDCRLEIILARSVEPILPLAVDKGVRLRVRPTDAICRTDPNLLERIVSNLVSNAVKYTPAGGRVLVGCRPRRGYWGTSQNLPKILR